MLEKIVTFFENEQEEELINLLAKSTPGERKAAAAAVKKEIKKYFEWKADTGYIGTHKQKHMAVICGYFFCSQTEFEKLSFSSWILSPELFNMVIDHFRPDWFGDYINKQASGDMFYAFNYDMVMRLMERGILVPNSEVIARVLPNYIYETESKRVDENRSIVIKHFKPAKLLNWPVTLQDHIWRLFETPSNIHGVGRYHTPDGTTAEEEKTWINALKIYGDEGKIDRSRLLREALLSSNKNFDKNLSGWFAELFLGLQPTEEELIELQPIIFSVLSSTNSKPVNSALTVIKKIVVHKQFDAAGFLDICPILLSSKTKSIISSVLMILEKMAKKHPQLRAPACIAISQVFMQTDEDLQTKAAKIINTFRADLGESFGQALSAYENSMMTTARGLLKDLITTAAVPEEKITVEPLPQNEPVELTPIPTVDTFDDFLFLASQLTDNNHSWMIDVFPAALLKMQHQLKGDNIAKLEPALQRPLKLLKDHFRSHQGYLDHMLSIFFVDVCIYLIRKYPADGEVLKNLFDQFDKKDHEGKIKKYMDIGQGKMYLASWTTQAKDPVYLPYKNMLLTTLLMLRDGVDCPLLSTPTHEPAWIDPVVLVQRWAEWQQQEKKVQNMDVQLALSRCLLHNTAEAAALAQQLLVGEKLNLLLFLFGKHAEPQGQIVNPALWMVASLTRAEKRRYAQLEQFPFYKKPFAYYTGQHAWESVEEEFTAERRKLEAKYYSPFPAETKLFRIHFETDTAKQTKSEEEVIDYSLLYDFLEIKATYFSTEGNDMRRLFSMVPHNPEPLLAIIAIKCLHYTNLTGEADKKIVIAVLQFLHETWNHVGNMAHVFLGTCMLASDKTVVNIAGEIWLKQVTKGKIDNAALGKVIGTHQKIEFAPLKRFTDLVAQQLLRVSTQHNKALQVVLENILIELPPTPIKNLKKLLEIYNEVVAINKSAPGEAIVEKLNGWKKAK